MNDNPAPGFFGLDGCRAGWVAALLNPPHALIRLELFASFRSALEAAMGCLEIWVDMPIGLSGDGVVRHLDRAMRSALKARKSSVFPAPSRATLLAETYQQARQLELQQQGRSLSAQAYRLIPKIREVDQFLQSHTAWRDRVYESHPELCFQRLNGDRPLRFAKKESAGWEERADLLERHAAGVRQAALVFLGETRRSQVQADDVLDAAVLAVSAWINRGRRAHFIRQAEEKDAAGIPLRIACPPAHPAPALSSGSQSAPLR